MASNKLQLKISNALDRFINIVSAFLSLSRACFHFSIIFSKAFFVLWFSRNLVNSGVNFKNWKFKSAWFVYRNGKVKIIVEL